MTLTELAEWLVTDRGNDRRVDVHLASQHCFLVARDGTPAVDYVGRVEDSDADVGALQGLLGLEPARIPRDNTNAQRKRVGFDTTNRWREVLDDRTIGLLTARYESDFELLGYPRLRYKVIPVSFPGGPAAAATPTPRTLRWRVAKPAEASPAADESDSGLPDLTSRHARHVCDAASASNSATARPLRERWRRVA